MQSTSLTPSRLKNPRRWIPGYTVKLTGLHCSHSFKQHSSDIPVSLYQVTVSLMMPARLFALYDDTARVLSSLLDDSDLEALTSVSTTARSSCFQSIRDAKPSVLVLPYTDEARVQTLLRGFTPSRLLRYAWIQLATPWHVDVFMGCGLVGFVSSVRVVPESSDFDGGVACIVKICETLPLLTSVTTLDLSDTTVGDLSFLSGMAQLQEVNLSGTRVVDVSSLSSFPLLRSLTLENSMVIDLSCLESMRELECLRVSGHEARWGLTSVPPLRTLTKLRTLELKNCIIDGGDDLLVVAIRLERLQLSLTRSRRNAVSIDPKNYEGFDVDELRRIRGQLEACCVPGTQFDFGSEGTTLTRIDRLRVVCHSIERNLPTLVTHEYLQELHISLPESVGVHRREPHDFTVLLQLPVLTSLKITQTIHLPWHYSPDPEDGHNALVERDGRELGKVLVQLTQLKRLSFSGWIDAQATLSQLIQLEHLELGTCNAAFTTFDWIRSYQSLRSLRISVSPSRCDLSGIGLLTRLEELDLYNAESAPGTITQYSFLGRLVNLKKLRLTGTTHDFAILRGMRSLESLTIKWSIEKTNVEVLADFVRLHTLSLANIRIKDVSVLARLPRLRSVWIPSQADCMPLVQPEHPTLLRLFHPHHNCLLACRKRNGHSKRKQLDADTAGVESDNRSSSMFSAGGEDY